MNPSTGVVVAMDRREKRQRIWLVVFASLSTFFYAGGIYGWGPMQLLLEANGNFASRCNYDDDVGSVGFHGSSTNTTTTTEGVGVAICPEQTAAFLNCRFVSQLTLLTGTSWGMLSDRYGKKVPLLAFGGLNILGLILLIVGVRFPSSSWESFLLYAALILIGLGSTIGGILTVETGLLFQSKTNDNKTQHRVIALLNSCYDAGAIAYLGLWAIEKQLSSSGSNNAGTDNNAGVAIEEGAGNHHLAVNYNPNLIAVLGGYLALAVICIGGYAYFFRAIQKINEEKSNQIENENDANEYTNDDRKCIGVGQSHHSNNEPAEMNGLSDSICQPTAENETIPQPESSERVTPSLVDDSSSAQCHTRDDDSNLSTYNPIALRPFRDQLLSRFYVLLGIWFSFSTLPNLWALTTTRDFLGYLGDDEYGNRYLSIFTLLMPFSVVALPLLDRTIRKRGFHFVLQAINGLGIASGIVKLIPNLDVQVVGFVIFTFQRCFLYSGTLTCVAAVIGPNAIGTATGTLFVLSGLASLANLGLGALAVVRGSFFVPHLVFLVGTLPLVYLTYEIGRVLERDQKAKEEGDGDVEVSSTPDTTVVATTTTTTGASSVPPHGDSSSAEC